MSRVLRLTLKKKWFDMIASGEKKEEYREVGEWSVSRLLEMTEPLVFDRAGNKYKKLISAYWFSIGYKKHRISAVRYLLRNCCEWRQYDAVCFSNGYRPDSPRITLQFNGVRIQGGKPEWGAEPGKKYFVIKLGERINT